MLNITTNAIPFLDATELAVTPFLESLNSVPIYLCYCSAAKEMFLC